MKVIKYIALSLFLGVFTGSVTAQQPADTIENKLIEGDTTQQDTTEYELVVISPGYESFVLQQPPMEHYSKTYYENWNERYVVEWNSRYMNATHYSPNIYEVYINYDPGINYGYKFEYRLYYFFRYMEDANHISLLGRRR